MEENTDKTNEINGMTNVGKISFIKHGKYSHVYFTANGSEEKKLIGRIETDSIESFEGDNLISIVEISQEKNLNEMTFSERAKHFAARKESFQKERNERKEKITLKINSIKELQKNISDKIAEKKELSKQPSKREKKNS